MSFMSVIGLRARNVVQHPIHLTHKRFEFLVDGFLERFSLFFRRLFLKERTILFVSSRREEASCISSASLLLLFLFTSSLLLSLLTFALPFPFSLLLFLLSFPFPFPFPFLSLSLPFPIHFSLSLSLFPFPFLSSFLPFLLRPL